MSRNLRHEYELLKEQYNNGDLTADQKIRGIQEIAEAYMKELDDNGLIPRPLEVPASA